LITGYGSPACSPTLPNIPVETRSPPYLSVCLKLFKGFLLEVFGILALAAGTLAAVKFHDYPKVWFESIFPPGPSLEAAGFISVFIAVWLAVKVMGWMLSRNMGEAETNPFSRLAGGALGLCKCVLFISMFIYTAESAFPGNKFTGHNKVTPLFLDVAHRIQEIAPFPTLPDISNLPDSR